MQEAINAHFKMISSSTPPSYNKFQELQLSLISPQLTQNKKDMKPFHIDRELECPILFYNVLSCLRTSYSVSELPNTVLERPNTVLEHPNLN